MPRILLVDDDIAEISAVKRVLAKSGLTPVLATNASDARVAVAHRRPDMLIVGATCENGEAVALAVQLSGKPATRDLPMVVLGQSDAAPPNAVVLQRPVDPFALSELVVELLARPKPIGEPMGPASGGKVLERVEYRAPRHSVIVPDYFHTAEADLTPVEEPRLEEALLEEPLLEPPALEPALLEPPTAERPALERRGPSIALPRELDRRAAPSDPANARRAAVEALRARAEELRLAPEPSPAPAPAEAAAGLDALFELQPPAGVEPAEGSTAETTAPEGAGEIQDLDPSWLMPLSDEVTPVTPATAADDLTAAAASLGLFEVPDEPPGWAEHEVALEPPEGVTPAAPDLVQEAVADETSFADVQPAEEPERFGPTGTLPGFVAPDAERARARSRRMVEELEEQARAQAALEDEVAARLAREAEARALEAAERAAQAAEAEAERARQAEAAALERARAEAKALERARQEARQLAEAEAAAAQVREEAAAAAARALHAAEAAAAQSRREAEAAMEQARLEAEAAALRERQALEAEAERVKQLAEAEAARARRAVELEAERARQAEQRAAVEAERARQAEERLRAEAAARAEALQRAGEEAERARLAEAAVQRELADATRRAEAAVHQELEAAGRRAQEAETLARAASLASSEASRLAEVEAQRAHQAEERLRTEAAAHAEALRKAGEEAERARQAELAAQREAGARRLLEAEIERLRAQREADHLSHLAELERTRGGASDEAARSEAARQSSQQAALASAVEQATQRAARDAEARGREALEAAQARLEAEATARAVAEEGRKHAEETLRRLAEERLAAAAAAPAAPPRPLRLAETRPPEAASSAWPTPPAPWTEPFPPAGPAEPGPVPADGEPLPLPPAELRSGHLDDLAFPRWLWLAARAQVTGRLDVAGEAARSLWFEGGRLLGAASNVPAERVEEVALRLGLLTREQHRAIAGAAAALPPRRAAVLLVERGYVKPGELTALVRRRTEEVAFGIFSELGARFRWSPDPVPPDERVAPERPLLALALEGVRRRWQTPRLEAVLGGPDALLAPAPGAPDDAEVGLSAEDRRCLALADGLRTVDEIVASSPLDALSTRQLLAFAVLVKRLEPRLVQAGRPRGQVAAAIDLARLQSKLEQVRRDDYFTILGVGRLCTPHEVREAADRILSDLDPGRFEGRREEGLTSKLFEIQHVVAEARAVLVDDGLRGEYLRGLGG